MTVMYTKKIISQRLVLLPYTLCRLTSITSQIIQRNTVDMQRPGIPGRCISTVLRCNI